MPNPDPRRVLSLLPGFDPRSLAPLLYGLLLLALSGCGEVWNNPYPANEDGKNILYTAFVERPKHLDPVQSYTEDEAEIIGQIYEPPLQYHYLKRPYTLVPLTVTEVPKPTYFNAAGQPVGEEAADVAFSVYELRIRPGIRYQPHPAFAQDESGRYVYHDLPREEIAKKWTLADFPQTGTRELTADDYVYQIKRLAHPHLHSPIYGLMSQYIVGLPELSKTLQEADRAAREAGKEGAWIDLAQYPLEGAQVVDRYTYRIKVKGRYPQFVYWLAMNFFAPVPREVDRFYAQPGMRDGKNLSLDWYPVGTGPYMLTENNPNARMVLVRNPNFRGEPYPDEGEPGDREAGLLRDAGKPMPFIDQVVFSREKESIPYWNKFLQGYYDSSGISSDSFDQAVQIGVEGQATLTPEMEEKGIRLSTSVSPSSFYLAFNWLDGVVGGDSERARKLRQAVSIAMDWEEFISIFANGRGIAGQGPVPPGIFGFREGAEGINPVIYQWQDGKPVRKSIEEARKLLAEAGYPNGRDARTGQPLVLYLDTTDRGPGDKSRLDWYRKQFAKLNIQLEIRATDWNRFQEKIRTGNTQLFFMGWNADYPDPENFLFLFYGPQSRAKTQGENAANYSNPEYDALFQKMKSMANGPERQAVIDRMVDILRRDAPWSFGFHPKAYSLYHAWLGNVKPNQMARNELKYRSLDAALRAEKREAWNQPSVLPMVGIAIVLVLVALPAIVGYRRRERAVARPA